MQDYCKQKTTSPREAGTRSRCDTFLVVSTAPLALELAACPSLVRRRPSVSGSTGQHTGPVTEACDLQVTAVYKRDFGDRESLSIRMEIKA